MSTLDSNTALPVADRAQVRGALRRLIRADRRAFAIVLTLNCAAAAAGLLAPWLLGSIVDAVRSGGGVRAVDRLGGFVLLAALAQFVLGHQARYRAHRFGERTAARLREELTDRLLRLPARTVERAGPADLTSRATTDAGLVSTVLRDAAPEMIFAVGQATIVLTAVLLLSLPLGLLALFCLVPLPLVLRWYLRRARAAYLHQAATNADVTETLASTVAGARTVENLGLQDRRAQSCARAVRTATAAQLRTLRLRSVLFPTIDLSTTLAVGVVFAAGGLLHLEGRLSLGTVVAVVLYVRQLSAPIDTLLVWVETLQSGAASFARLEGLAVPQNDSSRGSVPQGRRIVLTDVHHGYDDTDVLHDIDLEVEPGERLAVVGTSGAGKSTLVRLIAGIDKPRTGRVTVGGVDVADLPPGQVREHVVLVTQDHHVFADPLRDNLTLAAPDVTDDELHAALRLVGADWIDALPDGLDTDVGDHRLDGAHAQQIALARVVLADPHTLVLDEATALLDPRTARRTERALAATLRGRTVISVVHRLQTARAADRIAVLEAGRLVELGSHGELLAAQGPYARLWRAWTRPARDLPG